MRPAASLVPGIARRAYARRGFSEPAVLTGWAEIVGPALASETAPEKLVFSHGDRTGATLYVRVSGAFATELQHLEPLVIERINRHFGYAAVGRLSLRQAVIYPRRTRQRPKSLALSADQERYIEGRVATIGDETLRRALKELGSAILASRERPRE